MKVRATWMLVPVLALSLGACKKKESAPKDASGNPVEVIPDVPGAPESAPPMTPEVTEATPAERAAKLGFVKYLPKETEAVFTVYQGNATVEKAKSLKLWKLIEADMNSGPGGFEMDDEMEFGPDIEMEPDIEMTPDDLDTEQQVAEPEDGMGEGAVIDDQFEMEEGDEFSEDMEMEFEEPLGPGAFLGQEVVFALGKGSMEQIGYMNQASDRFNYFRFRNMTMAFLQAVREGDADGLSEVLASGFSEEMFNELLQDPESGVDLIDKMKLPPILIGLRTTDEDREAAASQIHSTLDFLGMMGEMVEPVSFEKAGTTFSGYRVLGSKLAEMLNAEREDAPEEIDAATLDRLVEAISKKNLIVSAGVLDEYVVLMLGSSEEDFNLVENIDDSIVSSDALEFSDAYMGEEISAIMYGQEESLKAVVEMSKEMNGMIEGVRDGLATEEGLGDTRNIEALLQMVIDRGQELAELQTIEGYGMVAYFKEGYHIEVFGGVDAGAMDWEAPLQLAHLGDSPDVVLFANGSTRAVYNEKLSAYLNSIAETLYAIAIKASELPDEGEEPSEMAQYKSMLNMFDTQFREDLLTFWQGYAVETQAGLGQESAWVLDFKGSFPTVPGIPQAVVDQGKFPRTSYITPVVDRSKLAAGWEKINLSTTSLLGKVSEMTGMEIPMQKPMSSEKDSLTTWFFPMPFFNDDFLPSVSVSDDWFVASTSKNQSLELVNQAKNSSKGDTGFRFKANFVALQNYARECYALVDANAAAIFGEDSTNLQEFQSSKEEIVKYIDSLDDFDSIMVRAWQEEGVQRASFHFKTR